jgi:hypothetical protein
MKPGSPIVTAVALVVAVLSIAVIIADPASWWVALLALGFLPVAGWILFGWAGRNRPTKSTAAIRASMVGGGALLASALGTRLATEFGWISEDSSGRNWVSLVLVLVVVGGDYLAARMERDGR